MAGLIVAVSLVAAACGDTGTTSTTQPPAPEATTATVAAPPATSAPATTTLPTPPPTTVAPTTTTTLPPRFWDGLERLNIMLLGSDAGVGRTGTRTDTVIVVSIEPVSGDVAMISLPRNLTEAPLPEGMGRWSCNCFPDIIAHLWANGEWYPEAFPGPQAPSVNALKAAVGLTLGIDVHYYAKVDLAGFVGMVDALGGVTIDVPKRIVDSEYPHELGGTERVVIEPGLQHLDGHLALAYSRTRRQSGDFARMHRQRCVLGSLARDADAAGLAARLADIEAAVATHVETDIPLTALPDLLELLARVEIERVATLRVTRHNYATEGHAGYQLYDLERLRADTRTLIDDPTAVLNTQDGAGFEATCALSFD